MHRVMAIVSMLLLWGAVSIHAMPVAVAQQPPTVRFVAPEPGASLAAGPVAVIVEIGGVQVRPAADGDASAFHHHLLIDVDPASVIQPGQPLPVGQANIIHTADLMTVLPNLAPGPHTITTVLTKTDHVPLSPAVQDQRTFTVLAPGQTPPAPAAPAPAPAPRPGLPNTGTGAATGNHIVRLELLLIIGAIVCGAWVVRRAHVSPNGTSGDRT